VVGLEELRGVFFDLRKNKVVQAPEELLASIEAFEGKKLLRLKAAKM